MPILLMSGYSGRDFMERAELAGVDAVLRKPLMSRDIAEPIARVLASKVRQFRL
jgi:AmiR/NasT family two-component response regulator